MSRAKKPDRRILLLTGRPGVGKTTVLRRAAELLQGRQISGFFTAELRDGAGRRRGFEAVVFGGGRSIIAEVGLAGAHRVGKYGVDVAAIDRLAEATLRAAPGADIYLVDEIGKMECLSGRFVMAVEELVHGGQLLVATVAHGGSGLIAQIKSRPDAEVREVTTANREGLPRRVAAWVSQRLSQASQGGSSSQ